MSAPEPQIYEFDDFRLDASRKELRRRGEPLPLTPKAFDTLLYFVRHPGTVLRKDELMSGIWPDSFVEPNNLEQAVSALRKKLGEGRPGREYIETVPRRGYRFAAEVTPVENDGGHEGARAEGPPSSPQPPVPKAGGLRSRVWRAVLVCVLAAALGGGALYLWRARTGAGSDAPIRTIAVLPFKPLVHEGRDEALELGMADTLITKLSASRELIVLPISSVRKYGGLEQDPVAAGRELGAEAVLDGTVQRSGDRVRVTARLLQVGNGRTLWAGQFDDQKFGDIFAVQDSISEKVAGGLALRLTGEERERLTRRHTADPEAYELYLKGRFFISLAQPRRAIELFEQAVSKDKNFALAHAGLADIYSRLPIAADAPPRETIPKAKEAARRALEIDDRLAEAHTALGWISFYYDWDWKGSEANHRRALEINPSDFSARLGYAHLLSNTGSHEEALREVEQAVRLDPRSPLANALKGQFLFHARRYPEATEQLRKTLESSPAFWVALVQLGRNYEREGRYEEALEAFRKARESGGTTAALSFAGYTYAASGQKEEAERVLRELRSLSEGAYVPPYNLALVYHGLGDTNEASRWLERAYDERDVGLVFLGVDPLWDSLRSDARFTSLLERMKLRR